MASPISASQLIPLLKKWGVTYDEVDGWQNRNRNHKGKWGSVHGFMWHHTGSNASVADQINLLVKGYADLPGPLCHFGIDIFGVCHIIGWGRANHAGLGDDDVLDAVIAEKLKLPVDDEANTDGNARFYGAEFMYSGSKPMTARQYNTGILLSCAIMDFHNWNENSILGHGQWQPGKWDPGYASGKMMDMEKVQADIAARFAKGPKGTVNPPPVDNNKVGSTVPAQRTNVTNEVWYLDTMLVPSTAIRDDNKYWPPASLLKYACEQAAEANRKADEILKLLKKSENG